MAKDKLMDFEQALELTVAWHKENLRRQTASMRDFTVGQIREYAAL